MTAEQINAEIAKLQAQRDAREANPPPLSANQDEYDDWAAQTARIIRQIGILQEQRDLLRAGHFDYAHKYGKVN